MYGRVVPAYTIEKRSTDKTIANGRAKLLFTCYMPNGYKLKNGNITVNYNNQNHSLKTDTSGIAQLPATSGKYKVYIYAYDYKEITIDTLVVASQEKIEIRLRFASDHNPHPVRKPVIYLYPTEKTDVNVQLNVKGNLIFTYPAYNTGWNVTAYPNGNIEMNGNTYNYLFWEANAAQLLPTGNSNEGSIIGSDTLLNFLENSLTAMGLNSKEQQDFITYWYPQMADNKQNFIRFVFNNDCNTYAELTITPKPKLVYRVYMIWSDATGRNFTNLTKQNFPVLKREGFAVVEWGGIELQNMELYFCGN